MRVTFVPVKSIFVSIGSVLCLLANACTTNSGFQYFVTGNASNVTTETRGLLVMQGGGDDVDINYSRMGEFAGGGDFVVLRASGTDDYNEYIMALCACDSVETIVFDNRDAAFDEFVLEKIRNAEALFIAGGDQSRYVRFWKGTPVEDAINIIAAKPVPIGGTSAGMAIMGEFSYSAMTEDSLTADVALANPYHRDVTIEADFLRLPGMQNLITDQHLVERDRIGRTVTLLARLLEDNKTTTARAIAADRETSVHLIPSSGEMSIHATPDHETPFVYMLRSTKPPDACTAGQPLSISNVDVYRLSPGNSFNVFDWKGTGGLAYSYDVVNGKLQSSRELIY